MTLRTINIGTAPDSGDGDTIRSAFDKINLNFSDIAAGNIPNSAVTSVAGKTGNVSLVVTDVSNAASLSFVNSSISTLTAAINIKANLSDATQTVTASNLSLTNSLVVTSNVNIGAILTVASNTATPAGGSTSAKLLFGNTAGFGIYYGSGIPTVSAAQGSLYLRSDGSSVNTRMYINTTGSNVWTGVSTVA